ncbi:TPA: hypothetical protein ACN5NN_001052, partial [Escherichia coli]
MAITIQCYSESDNAAFFGGDLDHEQLPAPTYDEPKARTGKPPVVIDNRSVRLWLIETGCLSYSQLAEAYRKRLVRTVLIFTESSDQLSRATDRV